MYVSRYVLSIRFSSDVNFRKSVYHLLALIAINIACLQTVNTKVLLFLFLNFSLSLNWGYLEMIKFM